MSTADLKIKLIEKIEGLREEHFLEELLGIIELKSSYDTIFNIPKEHNNVINQGLSDLQTKKTIPHADVMTKQRSCN